MTTSKHPLKRLRLPFNLTSALVIIGAGMLLGGLTHLVAQLGFGLKPVHAHTIAHAVREQSVNIGMTVFLLAPMALTLIRSIQSGRFEAAAMLSIRPVLGTIMGTAIAFVLTAGISNVPTLHAGDWNRNWPLIFLGSFAMGFALHFGTRIVLRHFDGCWLSTPKSRPRIVKNTDQEKSTNIWERPFRLDPNEELRVPASWK